MLFGVRKRKNDEQKVFREKVKELIAGDAAAAAAAVPKRKKKALGGGLLDVGKMEIEEVSD